MIAIDTNALVVLIVGLIDPRLLKTHRRTSIYKQQDFEELSIVIGNISNLNILSNVWTETDNLLNNFTGNYKYQYIQNITASVQATTEIYVPSKTAVINPYFFDLGLTDCLLLEQAKTCSLLITSDSTLSDYATALGIQVYDVVKNANNRL